MAEEKVQLPKLNVPKTKSSDKLTVLNSSLSEMQGQYNVAKQELDSLSSPYGNLSFRFVQTSKQYLSAPTYKAQCDNYHKAFMRVDELGQSIALLEKVINNIKYETQLKTESDMSGQLSVGPVAGNAQTIHQNVMDVGGEEKDVTRIGDSALNIVERKDLEMEGFLSRPIQLVALQLDMTSDIDLAFNVWSLFLSNPTIRAKLRNYAFLKCDLNVRIAVSGTPFHYGRLLAAYVPFVGNQSVVVGPSFRLERLKRLTQTIGAKTIDVKENSPLEMSFPYLSPQPIGRLFNNSTSALSDSTPYDDFDELGTLYISTLNQINAVSTTATNVYLYIYAYATNVHVVGSTGSVGVITTESDERERGPVERFAGYALQVSKALENVPSIGIFAKASSMALGALRGVASLFGWSYPNLIAHPMRVRPDPYQNGANVIGMDCGKRITLDPKQEVTVDPRICSVTEDELTIQSICDREGLLDQFSWQPTDTPLSTILWTVAVSPRSNHVWTDGTSINVTPTPVSFATTPFKFWRGKMIYRFEIVISNFHRGKLMFTYEPNIRQYGLITANLNTNKQYNQIIDIQETQSVEFEIDWNYAKPYCKAMSNDGMLTSVGDQFATQSEYFDCCNGVFIVTPFTELQSPDGSSIQINVFCRASEMAVNRLSDELVPNGPVFTEASYDNSTHAVSTFKVASEIHSANELNSLYFGEHPVSFRTLLKRFVTSSLGDKNNDDSTSVDKSRYIFKVIPTENSGASDIQYPYSLITYLRYAFLGMRGGLRKRIQCASGTEVFNSSLVTVSLLRDSETTVPNGPGTNEFVLADLNGSVLFNLATNSGVEFEVPFYTNNLFLWACNTDPWYNAGPYFEQSGLRNYLLGVLDPAHPGYSSIQEYTAAAEDFTLIRWLYTYPYQVGTTSG